MALYQISLRILIKLEKKDGPNLEKTLSFFLNAIF